MQFSPLRYRSFISLEKANLSFKRSLSETPFKPDRVSFCTPNFKNPEKNTEKTRLKPGKNLLEKVESTQKVGDLVIVMTDRGRTTHVPARGKTQKKPGSIVSPTPSSPTPLAGAE